MQQQQAMQHQSEANWAGSVAGGPARSVKSIRQQGYAASVASFAGSTSKAAAAAATAAMMYGSSSAGQVAAASNSGALSGADEDDNSSSSPSGGIQRPGSIVRGSGSRPTVSFTGALTSRPGPGEEDNAGQPVGIDLPRAFLCNMYSCYSCSTILCAVLWTSPPLLYGVANNTCLRAMQSCAES